MRTPFPLRSLWASLKSRTWKWAWPSIAVLTWGVGMWWAGGASFAHREMASASAAPAQHMPWKLVFRNPDADNIALPDEAEALVRLIYRQLEEGQRAQALETAEHLSTRFPNFQLGQLLFADLLNIELQAPVDGLATADSTQPAAHQRLQELLLESARRLLHPPATELQGKVPAGLLYLDPEQHPFLAVVDAARSRLYWFANRTGIDGQPRLELQLDTYISVGLNGVGKEREGDGRTPLGVYFIQKNLPGASLPDLFGAGALTLNYPNAVDVLREKTGSGIWLHGTPSAQYSRAPQASDGCVVLSNPQMSRLLELDGLRMTPVVIARNMEWLATGEQAQHHQDMLPRLMAWIRDRHAADPSALTDYYSSQFERDGQGLAYWWPRLVPGRKRAQNALEVVSVLGWRDTDQDYIVATLKDPNRRANGKREFLRTYWMQQDGQWKIVFEGPI